MTHTAGTRLKILLRACSACLAGFVCVWPSANPRSPPTCRAARRDVTSHKHFPWAEFTSVRCSPEAISIHLNPKPTPCHPLCTQLPARGSLRQTDLWQNPPSNAVLSATETLRTLAQAEPDQSSSAEPLGSGATCSWRRLAPSWGVGGAFHRLSQGETMGQSREKSDQRPRARQSRRKAETERETGEREQRGMISEHQHWCISSWLLYRGYIRDILKDVIEGASESCSTLRVVVKALWHSVKSHWQELEGDKKKKKKKGNRRPGTGLMEGELCTPEWEVTECHQHDRAVIG